MVNHLRVSLLRFTRRCPVCGGPQDVHTSAAGATRIAPRCLPYCRLNNHLLVAGIGTARRGEQCELDDRLELKGAIA